MRDSFSLTVNLTAALFASSLNEGALPCEIASLIEGGGKVVRL